MYFLWVLAAFWALYFYNMNMSSSGGTASPLLILLVAAAPCALLAWLSVSGSLKRKANYAAMLSEAGVKASSGNVHREGATGIALNKDTKSMGLLADGFWKIYPFSDVREWETRNGLGKNNGLNVLVKDVDHPKWRIEMKDDGIQARWMEILRQEINER
jgi:hypothetical protein